MEKDIFEILTDDALTERMDDMLLQDNEYQQIQNKTKRLSEQVGTIGLSKEQKLIVDSLASSYVESSCYYGRMAYQQGIRDCALLLREMELIKC